jgi:hypothetical protein
MPIASEIAPVARGLWIWHYYDSAVKADLFSTAIAADDTTYLIDPIRLASDALAELQVCSPIAGIVVTNENHERAAARFAEELQVPIHLHPTLLGTTNLPGAVSLKTHRSFGHGLIAVPIEGAPAGEVAIYREADGGTLIIGDALINFEPSGFALLPAKYCSDPKAMRRSLPKLLDYGFERMLFAHGTPILSGARQRLEQLLRNH